MKLLRVEAIDPIEDHWDITVSNTNTFYANDVLVHNSNGSVCYSNPDGFWIQSKENIITPLNDNAGCAAINLSKEKIWIDLIHQLADEYNIDLDTKVVSVYFEWCGSGIQKKTAVSGIDKKLAIVFSYFKVSALIPVIEDPKAEPSKWFPTKVNGNWIRNNEYDIFNINDFPTYEIKIDFENPLMSQNELVALVTDIIEPESPVGKQFGLTTIGEGLVASFYRRHGTIEKKGDEIFINGTLPSDELRKELILLNDGIYKFEI